MIDDNVMDVMKEKLSIEEYSAFLQQLIGSYEWDQDKKPTIQTSLDKIVERRNDEKLYLGIIGEFSSGKTTFINCLLQKDLLKTHAIQGTTTLTTFIEYAPKADLVLELHSGVNLTYRWDRDRILYMIRCHEENSEPRAAEAPEPHAAQAPELQAAEDPDAEMGFLARTITTGKDYAQEIRNVRLYYPSELLRQGIVIIDTPGVDSENPEHLKITATAIKDYCDLSLVMVPAGMAVSQTLTDFLTEYVPDSLHRCRFMLTKPELLRTERERDDILQYAANRLASKLHLDHVSLIPAPTMLLLEEQGAVQQDLTLKLRPEQCQKLTADFKLELAAVFDRLEKEKWVILSEKMIHLLDTLFSILGAELKNFETIYAREHEKLQKNKTADLEQFIASKTAEYKDDREQSVLFVRNEVNACITKEQNSVTQSFRSKLYGADSRSEIFDVIEQGNMEKVLDKSFKKIGKEFQQSVTAIDDKRHKDFETRFTALYNELATLSDEGLTGPGETLRADLSMLSVDLHLTNDSLAKRMTDAMAQETVMDKLSTVFDDKFGTSLNDKLGEFKKGYNVIVPKIEESIREGLEKGVESLEQYLPWLAKKAKKYLPDTLSKLRSEVIEKTETELSKYYNNVRELVRKNVPPAIDKIGDRLDSYCKKYKSVYGDLVASMREKDRVKSENLESLRRKVHAHQESLRIRRENLQELIKFYKTI